RKEIAVRLALGAGRLRLVRQVLTESLVLASAGGALGLLFAYWSSRVLAGFLTAGALDVSPDARVLAFTAIVSLLTGLLFGGIPALQATRAGLAPALKNDG